MRRVLDLVAGRPVEGRERLAFGVVVVDVGDEVIRRGSVLGGEVEKLRHPLAARGGGTAKAELGIDGFHGAPRCRPELEELLHGAVEKAAKVGLVPALEIPGAHFLDPVTLDVMAQAARDKFLPLGEIARHADGVFVRPAGVFRVVGHAHGGEARRVDWFQPQREQRFEVDVDHLPVGDLRFAGSFGAPIGKAVIPDAKFGRIHGASADIAHAHFVAGQAQMFEHVGPGEPAELVDVADVLPGFAQRRGSSVPVGSQKGLSHI